MTTPPRPAKPTMAGGCGSCYFWRQRLSDRRIVCQNAASVHHGEARAPFDGCKHHEALPQTPGAA